MSEGNDSSQERTEEPTPKRKQEAREKGQVPRSKELTTTLVLMASAVVLIMMGEHGAQSFLTHFTANFEFSRKELFDPNILWDRLWDTIFYALEALAPLFVVVLVVTIASSALLGGLHVSFKSIAPKFSKLNPLKGLKRMFSVKALMELVKALAKFLVVASLAIILLWHQVDAIMLLKAQALNVAIGEGLRILGWSFLALSATLIIIAAVDVPFQLHQHNSQLKMTFKELKDEFKDTEGKPEVKQKIRQLQQEMSQRRMMAEVPNADVVITNPEHFAVALIYNQTGSGAPVVVAKGMDFVALKIREIAQLHDVLVLEEPPLARAVYHSTEVDGEIPVGLYVAVAQVLAYVYQFKRFKKGKGKRPLHPKDLPIPEDLQR